MVPTDNRFDERAACDTRRAMRSVRAVVGSIVVAAVFAANAGCPDAVRGTSLDAGSASDPSDAADSADSSSTADAAPSGVDRRWSSWGIGGAFPDDQSSEGTVIDASTGLVWPVKPLDALVTWSDAPSACASARDNGFSDWRTPTRIELLSIIDYGSISPATRIEFTTPVDDYWSASEYADDSSRAWTVDFQLGSAVGTTKTESHRLRCVRGGKNLPNDAAHRFVEASGTVFDNVTSLVWQTDSVSARNFLDARDYCQRLSINGQTGFRVPLLHELHTLVDETRTAPALAPPFKATGASGNWSMTSESGFTWVIEFTVGGPVLTAQDELVGVRCVR